MAKKKDWRSEAGRRGAKEKPTSARSHSINAPNPKEDEVPPAGEEPIQAPLIPEAEIAAVEPTPIVNDRMVATYVGLSLSRDKDGEKLCSLEFSMTLTKEHDDYVPKKVADAHEWLVDSDNKMIQVNHIKPHTVDIYDEPNAKKPLLHVVGGTVEKASVAMIEETGKGKAKKVIRFVFRLCVERDDKAIAFGAWNDESQFWLDMDQTQRTIAD